MKKIYILLAVGVLSAISVCAQYSSPVKRQSKEMQTVQISSPLKENMFSLNQPSRGDSPLFEFDSLNVSYQGSWGFGQSFSISSNTTGNILFTGSGAGVIILDVTTPSNPVKLSEISTRGLVDAIFFDETTNRLYLTAYFAGFEIWDISDMTAPVKIGGGPTTGLPRGGIFASGNYVYVVTVADGVQVFDVTDPSNPVNTGNCPLDPNNFTWNSSMTGDLIFAACTDGGMLVVDVSDPANPHVAGTYNSLTAAVWTDNSHAYIIDWNFGLRILDISDLSNITEIGSCAITGVPYRVEVVGNYAYVANSTTNPGGGINVVNITAPANPQLMTTFDGYADHLTANGSVLAFAGSSLPCTILDIADPAAPVLANTYQLPIMTTDLEISGNLAYTGNNGFRVFDITDKMHPVEVGYNSRDGAIVRLAGDKAVFIRESMTADNPVMIMDVSIPIQPGYFGEYVAPAMTNDLEVRDHYAFVACWWDGIRVVDFQDPVNPVLVAHKMGWFNNAVPGVDYCYVQALDIEGDYLYLIDYEPFPGEETGGLYILDISDPVNPVFVSRFEGFISGGYDIDAVGNFVYIADNSGGVEVIDVTDKLAPVARGYVVLPDGANAIKVSGNHALVADYINGGVQVVNITDPDNPVIDGYYTPSGCFALGVNVQDDNIFLADGAGGFQIYNSGLITGISNHETTVDQSSTAYPDPFIDHVSIRINETAKAGKLSVYDASGRLMVTLSPSRFSQGYVVYDWDGRSFTGAEVRSGFYYYSTGQISGKMVKY